MRSAEVVIVGAGVIGASIAWHLSERGCRDILILERGVAPAGGSTSRATGGFRAQFGSPVNVQLSLLSREKLLAFNDEVGCDPGYHQAGYLFLAESVEALRTLSDSNALQRSLGLMEARIVGLDEIREINPDIRHDDVTGGAFCPTDGFIDPHAIATGYIEAARRLGVTVQFETEVTGFSRSGSRVMSVVSGAGEIACDVVVNAAGPWARSVAALAGVDLPVSPLRRQVAVTEPTAVLAPEMPMTIFTSDGFHLRVRDGRVLLLWPDQPAVDQPFDTSVDDTWISSVVSKANARVPVLRPVTIDRPKCWAGLYEMSPDHHAIVGRSNEVENFYLVNGSSGHGVMHAPALGQIVSEVIVDGRSSLDISALRPGRFCEGQANDSPVLL